MGQKINATGLRLKKKLNWNNLFSVHSYKNYSNVLTKVSQIQAATKIMLSKFHLSPNLLNVTKNSKTYNISSKLLNTYQTRKFTRNTKLKIDSFLTKTAFSATKQFNSLVTPSFYNFSKLSLKKQKMVYNKQSSVSKTEQKNMLLLSPKLVTAQISAILNSGSSAKIIQPSYNLSLEIPRLLIRLLQPFKDELLGIKVICSGRWRKTKSGRKQKLQIKYGKVKNPTLTGVVFFDCSSVKTKFGKCGIKVWISIKKNNVSSNKSILA